MSDSSTLVLIADDFEDAAELLATLLVSVASVETVIALDGGEAVGLAQEKCPKWQS